MATRDEERGTVMHQVIEEVGDLRLLDGACRRVSGWVSRVTQQTEVRNALSGSWLGHPLHPVLTDVPIGAWVMATLLDVSAGPAGARAARRLVGAGLLAAVPTAASGASDWSSSYGAAQRVGLVHAMCNATASGLQAASWLARGRGRRGTGTALSAVGLGLTLSSAYLGGYLSFVRGVGVNRTAFQEPVADWTEVAPLSAVADDRPLRVTAGGVPVLLLRHDGELYALSATCTHAGGPLDDGRLVGADCIRCPWHGSTFRLADGAVVRGPATVAAPHWDVKVDDGQVFVRSARPVG